MVTRKPVPSSSDSGLAPSATSPPYPITPVETKTSSSFPAQDTMGQIQDEDENAWSGEGLEKSATPNTNKPLPDLLRAGPPAGYTPRTSSSQEALKPQNTGTNPFLNRQHSGNSTPSKESSASVWGDNDIPAAPTTAPPPPPIPQNLISSLSNRNDSSAGQDAPSEQFENLSVSDPPSTNPWQPALDKQATGQAPIQESDHDAWMGQPARQAPSLPPLDSAKPILINVEEPESPAWDEDDDEASPVVHEMPADNVIASHQIHEDQHVWDETVGHPGEHQTIPTTQRTTPEEMQGEGWDMVDRDPIPIGAQQTGLVTSNGTDITETEEQAPPLPPRASMENPPAQPPRPIVDTSQNQSTTSITSPSAIARKQKKETYEIKRITWHDVTAAKNPRVSPILVQNANGPCPLLALVNALTLSTPADVETALVDTLRSREQVSLGLLLDAVFDELMSGRRGDAAQELPDVSDLYSFLITLHTGMNVNPRFLPSPPSRSSSDPRRSMSHIHPSDRESSLPGTLEETREMKLYSTFSVPLIHGWLAEVDSSAYTALKRSAQSYEDAQNLMFHEEGLEDKLSREGLSFEEQATLEDIATIKAFFSSNATQLTSYGLKRITESVAPGCVAILFRNDHFSTLYRHPDTLQLLQLVTDLGYAGHEEVVWESLIDVNGENAEFFSGDFRLVGGAPSTPAPESSQANDGWTTVIGRRNQTQTLQVHNPDHEPPRSPMSPNTEQEDHDLALALQLQEEEEERHRTETARRRRETELSQQYIEQQSQTNSNVPVSQRGGSMSRGRGRGQAPASFPTLSQSRTQGRNNPAPIPEIRPIIPPRRNNTTTRPVDPEAGSDAPPPSYEQAATTPSFNPPVDHPAHPSASPNGNMSNGNGNVRRTSAYTANSQSIGRAGTGRRVSGSQTQTLVDQIPNRRGTNVSLESAQSETGRKDCVVM